jgi:hypothetical protein
MSEHADIVVDDGEEVLAEIRAVRQRISEEFDHDPYKLVAYLMEQQKVHGDRLIRAPEPDTYRDEAA